MSQNLTNIPTALLVNALLDKLFEWQNEGRLPHTSTLVDSEHVQDNNPPTILEVLEELNQRQMSMPISDCIIQEHLRRQAAAIPAPNAVSHTPILSNGKD